VVDIELSRRKKSHRVETAAYKSVGVDVKRAFVVAEADSTDDETGGRDEEIGSAAWKAQQQARRSRYRMTTSSSALYDVESVREAREAREAARALKEQEDREKRIAQERAWAEASNRVETEASSSGGLLGGRMRRFTEQIEEGWTKDYAGKSTGLTAKKWDAF
jgi:hypothetical protein